MHLKTKRTPFLVWHRQYAYDVHTYNIVGQGGDTMVKQSYQLQETSGLVISHHAHARNTDSVGVELSLACYLLVQAVFVCLFKSY